MLYLPVFKSSNYRVGRNSLKFQKKHDTQLTYMLNVLCQESLYPPLNYGFPTEKYTDHKCNTHAPCTPSRKENTNKLPRSHSCSFHAITHLAPQIHFAFFWNLCINQIIQFMIFFWERIGSGLLLLNYLCCMLQQIISYCCIIFHGLAIHRICYLPKYAYISVGIYVQVQLLSHLCSISVYAASFSIYSPISSV